MCLNLFMDSSFKDQYLDSCIRIARDAGELIMTYFSGQLNTRSKDDNSPVTDADIAANTLITKALLQLAPKIPVIAEEDEEESASGHELFWLVDPLDGTRSFVRGEPEFTVNIGLIHHHKPVLGVIYAPPQQAMYWGAAGNGAFKTLEGGNAVAISVRTPHADGLVVTRSKSHPSPATTAYLKTLRVREERLGSSSIKFCEIAEGRADIYPRFGRTMEWDTAAGHAILNAAGGRVETVDGNPLAYGKAGYENPHFIAFGNNKPTI